MASYDQYYLLQEALENQARLIPSPDFGNFDYAQIYAALLDRLAQPLPNGDDSPFSSQDPSTAHAALVSAMLYITEMIIHTQRLIPDAAHLQMLRLMGSEIYPAEYAIINLEFKRSSEAIAQQLPTEIRQGTVVRSRYDYNVTAITSRFASASGSEPSISVPARLNTIGAALDIQPNEFSILVSPISLIDSVTNTGVVSPGRNTEKLSDAAIRVREGVRTGNLGRFGVDGEFNPELPSFVGRCVNPADYIYYAINLGATKARVVPPGRGQLSPMVVIYPETALGSIAPVLQFLSGKGLHLRVRAAEIIPIEGTISLRVNRDLTDGQVREIAARAIYPTYDRGRQPLYDNLPVGVNPPAGIWQDTNFAGTLATALENADGIYAVPSMDLRRSDTGQALSAIAPKPWHLFEIQSTIVFEVLR